MGVQRSELFLSGYVFNDRAQKVFELMKKCIYQPRLSFRNRMVSPYVSVSPSILFE